MEAGRYALMNLFYIEMQRRGAGRQPCVFGVKNNVRRFFCSISGYFFGNVSTVTLWIFPENFCFPL